MVPSHDTPDWSRDSVQRAKPSSPSFSELAFTSGHSFLSLDSVSEFDVPYTPPEMREEQVKMHDEEAAFREELTRAAERRTTQELERLEAERRKRRSLSPLKSDPKLAASNVAATMRATATTDPWSEGAIGEGGMTTRGPVDEWDEVPYVPHAREVRICTPKQKAHQAQSSRIPEEFHVKEDDPIFPHSEDVDFEVAANGSFRKTTFPAKSPTRRKQVLTLGDTLTRMLGSLDAEDAATREAMEAAYKEAAIAESNDLEKEISPEELKRRAQAEVQREKDSVELTVNRIMREDVVYGNILSELQRQVAVQSKDRAKLLDRLGEHYSELVKRAIEVGTGGSAQEEMVKKLAVLGTQIEALRSRLAGQVAQNEEKQRTINMLNLRNYELDALVAQEKAGLAKANRAKDKAQEGAAVGRALKADLEDFRHLNQELEGRIRELLGQLDTSQLETKQFKIQWEMEQKITANLHEEMEHMAKQAARAGKQRRFGGPRPVRTLKPSASQEAELEKLQQREKELQAAEQAAAACQSTQEAAQLRAEIEQLEAQRQGIMTEVEQATEAEAIKEAPTTPRQRRPRRKADSKAERGGSVPQFDHVDEEVIELQRTMEKRATRLSGLLDDAEGRADDEVQKKMLRDGLDAHRTGNDGDESLPESPTPGTNGQGVGEGDTNPSEGRSRLARMQLERMERQIAEEERKLQKARAARERMQGEEDKLQARLKSTACSEEEKEAAAVRLDALAQERMEAENTQRKSEAALQLVQEQTEILESSQAGVEQDQALLHAVAAMAEMKGQEIHSADGTLAAIMQSQAVLREELAATQAKASTLAPEVLERVEQDIAAQLMDLDVKRKELKQVRDELQDDLVIERMEAEEIGLALDPTGSLTKQQHSGGQYRKDAYVSKQFDRALAVLAEQKRHHEHSVEQTVQESANMAQEMGSLKQQLGSGDVDGEAAQAMQVRIKELEAAMASFQFLQGYEVSEIKAEAAAMAALEEAGHSNDKEVIGQAMKQYLRGRVMRVELALDKVAAEVEANIRPFWQPLGTDPTRKSSSGKSRPPTRNCATCRPP